MHPAADSICCSEAGQVVGLPMTNAQFGGCLQLSAAT